MLIFNADSITIKWSESQEEEQDFKRYILYHRNDSGFTGTNQDILGQGEPASWDEIRQMRNGMLWMTDSTANAADAPADLKAGVTELRQKLRDLPEALKDIDDIFVPSSFPSTKILEQK